jgi:hypothetical protein
MLLNSSVSFTLMIIVNYQSCFGEKVAEWLGRGGNSRNFAA